MATHYFLGSKLLGSSRLKSFWKDDQAETWSKAFICETCGEIWGRIAMDGAPWTAERRACIRHPNFWNPQGGSFLNTWRHTFEELPPEVLRYEVMIRLDRLEKEHGI